MERTGEGWELDYIRVTGRGDPLRLAQWLEPIDPAAFAWTAGKPTRRYAASLLAPHGIALAYGARNAEGLDCPQSDTRDSSDWCLEVPGRLSNNVRSLLHVHPDCRTMQAPRIDICRTWLPRDPAHVYTLLRELIVQGFGRPAHRIGPDGVDWQAVTLQTHEKQADAPRFLILYDKHSRSPDEYPAPGTLRLEVRLQPDKKHDKLRCFWESPDRLLDAWRFARTVREVIEAVPRAKSFPWNPPSPEADFERMTAYLVASYGPTICQGIAKHGADYLHLLGIASALQAAPRRDLAPAPRPAVPAAPASDQSEAVTAARPGA